MISPNQGLLNTVFFNIIPQHGQKRGGVVDYHDRVLGLDVDAGIRARLREALTRLRRRYL